MPADIMVSLPKVETITETTTTHLLKLGHVTLVDILRKAGYEIPITAEIFVEIPRGGDYSGEELKIHGDMPLCVRWEVRTIDTNAEDRDG